MTASPPATPTRRPPTPPDDDDAQQLGADALVEQWGPAEEPLRDCPRPTAVDSRLLVPALVALGVLLPLHAAPALACSCAGPSTHAESLAGADVVVSGDVVARREPPRRLRMSSGDPATYVLQVRRVHAGQAQEVLEVQTAASGASCGLELPSSGPVLLYAQDDDAGVLTGSLCGGSRTATDAEAVAVAGEGRPPAAAAPRPRSSGHDAGTAVLVVTALLTGAVGCRAAVRRTSRPADRARGA